LIGFNTQINKFIVVTFEYITDKIAILDAYRPTKEEIAGYKVSQMKKKLR
jgi:hypothetical protein